MTDDNANVETTTPVQEGEQTPGNVGGDAKPPENKPATLTLTQDALDKMMGGRAQQAKNAMLNKLGIDSLEALETIVKAQAEVETAKAAAEEANKTELQKKDEQLQSSIAVQTKAIDDYNDILVENAVMRLAPAKEVTPDKYAGLLALMDKTSIKLTDGKLDDEDVNKAIDATLAIHEYLKAATPDEPQKRQGTPLPPSRFGGNSKKPEQKRQRMKL